MNVCMNYKFQLKNAHINNTKMRHCDGIDVSEGIYANKIKKIKGLTFN